MNVVTQTGILLVLSNIFMTFAWYAYLRHLSSRPLLVAVFVPFAVFYMKQPVRLDFLRAGVCLMGAMYFIFRGA